MNRDRQHKETFYGKRTNCRYCKKAIKHLQKTIVVRWFDHRLNKERFTRFCCVKCADEFYYQCLTRKSGIYF